MQSIFPCAVDNKENNNKMAKYNSTLSAYSSKQKKKHGKAFKIIISIVIGLVVIAGVLFALNFKTITLMMGKGNIKVNTISLIHKSLLGSGKFSDVTKTTGPDNSQVLTSTSDDNAVILTVTQQESGKETINAKVDLNKMDIGSVDKKALAHGSPTAISAAKTLADKYVGSLVDTSDETGLEAYLATNLLSEYKSDPTSVNIDHTFGDTHLTLTGDLSSGNVEINLEK